ncbi:MAG: metallophosphoesterase [Rhodocyclaceae bacterium]|nr:metallophosphoesterase [Rhodocyclaceae bacterium]
MTAVILHLSDVHIKSVKDPILKRAKSIAACVFSSLPSASKVFIVVSGDIAFSGQADQYGLATTFFDEIRSAIVAEAEVPVSFVIVPGNHDCDFDKNNGARKMLINNIDESDDPEIDGSVIEICTSIQADFFAFRNALENNPDAYGDALWRTARYEVEGKCFSFECLNVSWISKLKEEPGHLYFPVDHYKAKKSDSVDVRLVVLHHPLNWFSQTIYKPFRTFLRQTANIIISGHEHQANVGIVHDAESEKSAFVEGCVLQGEKDLSDSAFNVVVLDIDVGQFASTRYAWSGDMYKPTEEGSWADYHDLPAKRANPFPIAESFLERLDDPGAFFKHPGQTNITLSDIFVYPDLRKVGNGEDKRRSFISAQRLLSPEVTADGALVEGEEKAGCTSLLFKLYRQYHGRGFVPVLICGKELRRTTDAEINSTIKHAVEVQYGKSYVEAFCQLPTTQKLLLIDNFDESSMKAADARVDLLCRIKKRFGHMVVTTGAMFEMREMLDGDASRQLLALQHYQLQPFGYILRSQLIERWFSLGADGTVDEATFIARCDQAERLMDVVIAKTVVPSHPLYLLTLLQSIEAGRSGDFKESALGYYYQYLLTEAFQRSGVKPEKLTEIFQYSAHLAWEFHLHKKSELTKDELREFNDRFSKHWVTVDFSQRLDVLLAARVLCQVGDDYKFRYPYIYYYLKGQYLSQNLSDLDVRAYIGHCTQHLYVRDHANTVLFLAHHSTDEFVLNSIAESLHGLFRAHAPVTFDGDTGGIKRLIEDAPKLTYSGESPVEHRKRRNELQDQLDDGHDGLSEIEESAPELSLIAQMTMLFKTTEILGQVLKNQYAKIPRTRKVDLLEDLFNGPLRAIRDFYSYLEKNPDALVAEIDAALLRKGKVDKEEDQKAIARRVVASLVQFITFAFVLRAAQSANSDSLSQDVRDVVKRNPTLAFKLIELNIILDSPKAIPRQKLKQLHKDVEKDLVAARILQIMVLNRLYMFKTSEQDMQWLNGELTIDLGIQHAITYQEKRRRLVK